MRHDPESEAAKPSLRERLIQHFVQTVPEELAVCEFSCSAHECSREEWQRCSRRRLAAGEQAEEPPALS
jgi:hypothetical protein